MHAQIIIYLITMEGAASEENKRKPIRKVSSDYSSEESSNDSGSDSEVPSPK